MKEENINLGLNVTKDGKLTISDVKNRLKAMKFNAKPDFFFDEDQANSKLYCIEFGIKQSKILSDAILDRYIEELESLESKSKQE